MKIILSPFLLLLVLPFWMWLGSVFSLSIFSWNQCEPSPLFLNLRGGYSFVLVILLLVSTTPAGFLYDIFPNLSNINYNNSIFVATVFSASLYSGVIYIICLLEKRYQRVRSKEHRRRGRSL